MELIMEQFPIVIQSLNIGFIQTLKLFFVTLLGAIPLGLVVAFDRLGCQRHSSDDPDAYYLLLPGTCFS